VLKSGGKVLGSVKAPAQHLGFFVIPAAGAKLEGKVVGLANAGGDTINAIKQAAEFGLTKAAASGCRRSWHSSPISTASVLKPRRECCSPKRSIGTQRRHRAFSKRFMERSSGSDRGAGRRLFVVTHYLKA